MKETDVDSETLLSVCNTSSDIPSPELKTTAAF